MKKTLMTVAIVLASATGALAAGPSQHDAQSGVQQNKHRSSGAATRSMNRGTSANGGMGTGGVTTGSGTSDNPANTSIDRSGRAGTSASPGVVGGPGSR
jgi:hypothetical protein